MLASATTPVTGEKVIGAIAIARYQWPACILGTPRTSTPTNVPVIESIQMFTALKLLGRDVAFIQVPGENHWIIDYKKRILWSDSIMAWFAKYLKGDTAWWDALYPKKSLELFLGQ